MQCSTNRPNNVVNVKMTRIRKSVPRIAIVRGAFFFASGAEYVSAGTAGVVSTAGVLGALCFAFFLVFAGVVVVLASGASGTP